jgi:two-component system, NarL family, invasion response regulator UvrY
MKKILIADDHDVVRAGLQRIISREFDDVEFIEAADSNEVLGKVANENPNLVLADIKMPGRSGIDILKDIHQIKPGLPVIILTAFPESQYGARAMENGAAGFVNKAHVNAELPTAIRRASEGGRYVSPQLAEVLAHYLGNKHARVPHESLSEREMQVMRLIASGRETGEIASDLCLSDKTIATYRSRIYEKLNVKNNVEIARYAMQHRLVD